VFVSLSAEIDKECVFVEPDELKHYPVVTYFKIITIPGYFTLGLH
jgi:hypothetical protein